MNPLVFWKVIAAVGTLLGIGGAGHGYDQHNKRKKEQAQFRQEIGRLEKAIGEKERPLESLKDRLGSKNDLVRILAAEVKKLRSELADVRRRASA
jgi:chromosome segregation ATPase